MNECKLIIEENFKNRKIKINNVPQEIEMINTYTTLYDTNQSRVIFSNLNEYCEYKINNIFQLSPNINKSVWTCIPWYNKKISSNEIYNNSLVKTKKFCNDKNIEDNLLDTDDNYFINLAMHHLTNNEYNVKKEGIIEYRHFNLTNNEHDAIYFDVYKDDEIFDFNVETCIFVTQTNDKISGNIDFYMISSPNTNKKFVNNGTNISKKEIKVDNNSIILISGNILYCPQPLYGNGVRNYIIVKLRSDRV
jgi:hypothetical protein